MGVKVEMPLMGYHKVKGFLEDLGRADKCPEWSIGFMEDFLE